MGLEGLEKWTVRRYWRPVDMPQSLARVETPRELQKSGYVRTLSRHGLPLGGAF